MTMRNWPTGTLQEKKNLSDPPCDFSLQIKLKTQRRSSGTQRSLFGPRPFIDDLSATLVSAQSAAVTVNLAKVQCSELVASLYCAVIQTQKPDRSPQRQRPGPPKELALPGPARGRSHESRSQRLGRRPGGVTDGPRSNFRSVTRLPSRPPGG